MIVKYEISYNPAYTKLFSFVKVQSSNLWILSLYHIRIFCSIYCCEFDRQTSLLRWQHKSSWNLKHTVNLVLWLLSFNSLVLIYNQILYDHRQSTAMLWKSSRIWSWLDPYSFGFILRKCVPRVSLIPKVSWLHHPRSSPANISATLSNYAMWFEHVVPSIENAVYAKNQLCGCPTYHMNCAVTIRSLRRRPYRMKSTAVGFTSLTTVFFL